MGFFLLLSLACQPDTAIRIRDGVDIVPGATYEARAEGAWNIAPDVTLSPDAVTYITRVNTAVVADVPDRVSGLPTGTKVLDLRGDTAIRTALLGLDEKAAAEAIRATGARVLIVHTALRPTMDRSGEVLSRLYHHDGLDYFQLARVEQGALVYLVTDGPLQLPPELAASAIRHVRDRLAGTPTAEFPPQKPERSNYQIIFTLRRHGMELATSLEECETLDRCLDGAVVELEAKHRRDMEVLGLPRLRDDMPAMILEMHRVTEKAAVVPRDEASLTDLWEMGLDGAMLIDRPTEDEKKVGVKSQSGVWPGSVAVTRSYTNPDQFLKALARTFKFDSVRPWRDGTTELFLLRTTHWLERPGGGVVPLYRGSPPIPMELVNQTTTRDAIILAGEWYLANLTPEGMVTYKFWPEENRYSNEYNHVRHTLATWNLWQAWTLDPRPEFLEGAIRSQNFTMRSTQIRDASNLAGWEKEKVDASPLKDEIYRDGMAYYTYADNTKLGSVVVGLLGMVEVARATGDRSNDELMRKLARFVLFMMEENGKFRPYHVPPGHAYEFEKNDIVPGEAALSLVLLYEYFNDPQYLEPLPRFFAYYKPWYDERAARRKVGMPWPAYTYNNDDRLELVQFGPWTVMAADAYTRVRPDAHEVAAFGLEVGRWMIESYEYSAKRSPFPDYLGGYYKFEGELPAMQAFCYGEGTAAAYSLALRMKPDEAAYFELATRENVRFAMQMQHTGISVYPFTRPNEVLGGIKYALNEPKVRIDYVHHALSAMYQWLAASKRDPNLPAIAAAVPDEGMNGVLRMMDYPSARAPGAFVRTSVPPSLGAGPELLVSEDSEGAE